MDPYKNKYLKYKNKYIQLKQIGGNECYVNCAFGLEIEMCMKNRSYIGEIVPPEIIALDASYCDNMMKQIIPFYKDNDRIYEALLDGTVDTIGTDHAPHQLSEKNEVYAKAPSGFPGFETCMPLLLNEVNKDSIRFMMLNRGNDVELEFDFDKVLEKSKENPVFYVQYSYARINSLFKTAKINLNKKIILNSNEFQPNIFDYRLLRKIVEWLKVVDIASTKHEPHRIPFYLYELVTIFHSYWSKGNEDTKFRFIENGKIKRSEGLVFIYLIAIVIKNGMNILGVSLPEKM